MQNRGLPNTSEGIARPYPHVRGPEKKREMRLCRQSSLSCLGLAVCLLWANGADADVPSDPYAPLPPEILSIQVAQSADTDGDGLRNLSELDHQSSGEL